MRGPKQWRTLFGVLAMYSSAVCIACAAIEAGRHHTIEAAAAAKTTAATAPAPATQSHSEEEPHNKATEEEKPHFCSLTHSMQQLQKSTISEKLAAINQLTSWLLSNKAEVNVEAREGGPGAGLALFALKDIKQGDVLLSLPTDLGFKRESHTGIMGFLLDYVLDVYDVNSPRALMWSTAPRPHELRHLLNFPKQYLPLLQNRQLEDWISIGLHQDMQLFYKLHHDTLAAAGIGYEDLIHAMGLIGTRIFNKPSETEDGPTTFYSLPLLDMANHQNSCPHSNKFDACHFDSSRECVYFTAGADVTAGEEVCFYYGYLLPDRALLEYGFLPQQEPNVQVMRTESMETGVQLSGIDRHDADFDAQPLMRLYVQPSEFTAETPLQIEARIQALQLLLQQLRAGDNIAGQIEVIDPAEGDDDGCFRKQLLKWRKQRQQAVAAEIVRLQSISQQLRGSAPLITLL